MALAGVGVLAGVGIAYATIGTPDRSPAAPATPPTSTPSASPAAPRGDAEPADFDRIDWTAELDRLDALRARAFAERRPALLRRVYLGAPLLAADAATLNRLVPPGCALRGAHTRYSPVQVSDRGSSAVLTATAHLAPARLRCGGGRRDTSRATVARLRIVLQATGSGVRIAAQRRLPDRPAG
jgi:hypothetical protein